MAWLARRLLVCPPLVILSVGCLTSSGSAKGLPRPPPDLNFTIGVEGVVWCNRVRRQRQIHGRVASPNAVALLRCRRGEWALSMWNTTDADGYFLIQTEKQVAPFTSKDCKVFVPRSPVSGCTAAVKPTRKNGAPLKFRRFVPLTDELQARYTAGNFTFAPEDPTKC